MQEEKLCLEEKNAEELREEIVHIIGTMTEAQLDMAVTLLHQWLLEGAP